MLRAAANGAVAGNRRSVVCRASASITRREALAGALLTAAVLNAPQAANAAPSSHSPFYKPNEIVFVPVNDKLLKDQGTLDWEIWEHGIDRYDYTYEIDEDVYFLKGKVIVTPKGGKPVTIQAGDYAVLPAGMSCEWNIVEPVKKHYKEYE